ncbi:MAG: L,D-transpeptidase [Muribaculaceae bacterium]|nr:L,D-transpeptidase [Muribaculaceae bacterium]
MREFISHSEHKEQYCRGIIPAMIEDVPEYAVKLLKNQHEGFLIVDKATMKIYRYNKYGELQESYGMACSKNFGTKHARRDNRTPEGFFSIEGKYDSTDWLYTDDDGVTSDVKGQFGPRFMRLKVPNTSQIGIHGTCAPWSIGGRRSHGCIRVTNENILKLFDIVQVGWPVIVSPGRKDYAVNMEEGYDIPTVPVIYGKPRALYSSVKTAAVHSDTGEHTLNDSTLSPHDVPVIDSVAVVHPSDSI